jgi:hypothetical protein
MKMCSVMTDEMSDQASREQAVGRFIGHQRCQHLVPNQGVFVKHNELDLKYRSWAIYNNFRILRKCPHQHFVALM